MSAVVVATICAAVAHAIGVFAVTAPVHAADALAVTAPVHAADEPLQLRADKTSVGVYGRIDFTIDRVGATSRPFDPAQLDLSLVLSLSRSGTIALPAFYVQPHVRQKIARDGRTVDWIYPSGPARWEARFTPMEPGTYWAVAVCKDRSGRRQSSPIRFEVVASDGKGFLRVCRGDPRWLELPDGKPVFLIGQNLAFVGESQYVNLAKAEEIFGKLQASGANFVRIWTCCEDWATSIEARKSVWGRSWDWRPPVVDNPDRSEGPNRSEGPDRSEVPDRSGRVAAAKCIQLGGSKPKRLSATPSHPLAVRPSTGYVLSGRMRRGTDASVRLLLDVPGFEPLPLAGRDAAWTDFSARFVTGENQRWLNRIDWEVTGQEAVLLDGLSLREAAGGPELLEEAMVDRPSRGHYHQLDCWVIDRLVESAGAGGLYLQLCLLTRDLYMPDLKDPQSERYREAMRDAKNLLRYAVARWGYSTSVAAWEYFNEIDPGLSTDPFYAELGRYLTLIDVYRHLRTTSAWSAAPKDWRHPQLDFAQLHHYLRPESKEGFRDEVDVVVGRARFLAEKAVHRPALLAEFGLAENNWQLSPYMRQDDALVHLHNCLWASAMSGLSGTTMFWWWEQLDRQDAYRHYRPLAAFMAGIPLNSAALRNLDASASDASLRAIGLCGRDRAYAWLFDRRAAWSNRVLQKQPLREVRGATLAISSLDDGVYRVHWWNTQSGQIVVRQTGTSRNGQLRLDIPPLTGDLAVQVTP